MRCSLSYWGIAQVKTEARAAFWQWSHWLKWPQPLMHVMSLSQRTLSTKMFTGSFPPCFSPCDRDEKTHPVSGVYSICLNDWVGLGRHSAGRPWQTGKQLEQQQKQPAQPQPEEDTYPRA